MYIYKKLQNSVGIIGEFLAQFDAFYALLWRFRAELLAIWSFLCTFFLNFIFFLSAPSARFFWFYAGDARGMSRDLKRDYSYKHNFVVQNCGSTLLLNSEKMWFNSDLNSVVKLGKNVVQL